MAGEAVLDRQAARRFAVRYMDRSAREGLSPAYTSLGGLIERGRRVRACDCGQPLCEGFVMLPGADPERDDTHGYGEIVSVADLFPELRQGPAGGPPGRLS